MTQTLSYLHTNDSPAVRKDAVVHIVLRHKDSPQLWKNRWLDENRPEWITTSIEVGMRCKMALDNKNPVRIHRLEWMGRPALICCECDVQAVRPIDEHQSHVAFGNWRVLEILPLVRPIRGQATYAV